MILLLLEDRGDAFRSLIFEVKRGKKDLPYRMDGFFLKKIFSL